MGNVVSSFLVSSFWFLVPGSGFQALTECVSDPRCTEPEQGNQKLETRNLDYFNCPSTPVYVPESRARPPPPLPFLALQGRFL